MTFIRKQDGFTLIELMVVVAILAILAIIAIPRILAALDNARRSEAVATATSVANAFARYYIEHEEYPLYHGEGTELDKQSDDIKSILLELRGETKDTPLGDYLDLRNPESIASMSLAHDVGTVPHDWELTVTFADARPEGAAADVRMVAVITPEHIVWEATTE